MQIILPFITALAYRLRGMDKYDWLGKVLLVGIVGLFLVRRLL
jgi:hypothetical protein